MKAVVKNGRLVMDEPTSLPEGTELVLTIGEADDELDEAERLELEASLRRGIAQARAGQVVPAERVLARLRKRR